MEQLLEQEEQSILHDVQSQQINFNLRNRIRNYIENNVQLNREGLKLTIKKLHERLVTTEKQLRKQLVQVKFQNEKLFTDLKTARFIQTEYHNQSDQKDMEIDMLKDELKEILEENQQLKDEKVRIMGVNSLLEQKIQVERSEMMSLQNEVERFVRVGGPESMDGGSLANRKMGKMSQYIRKQQNIMRSIRGSANSGFQSMHHAKRALMSGVMDQGPHGLNNQGIRGANVVNEFDRESQNQRAFIKYQTKKHIGNQSDYRGGGTSNRQRRSSIGLSERDIVINDDDSEGTSVFVRRAEGQSQSQYSQARSLRSKILAARARAGEQTSFKGSMRSSLRGSVRSGSRRGVAQQNRVQVISDFESDASIAEIE